MLDKFKHVNSRNEVLDFLSLGIYANENELRNYEWNVSSENDIITSLTREIVKKQIPFVFYCNEEKANEIKNKFFEHFEIDVLNKRKGYFEINGYRYYCFLTKSTKSDYLKSQRLLRLTIEVTTDNAFWTKEHKFNYKKSIIEHDNPTFSMSFPIKFGNTPGTSSLNIDVLSDSKFNMIVYGPVNDPSIEIGGNLYNVHVELDENEYLISDYENRTIEVVSVNGYRRDVFNKRNKDNDFFKKIKNGYNTVSWSGNFGFDIIVFEERSEPKWI